MAKQTKPTTTHAVNKSTDTGERYSVFFEKGGKRIRVRVFPSKGGYQVSAIQKEGKESLERSVERFNSLEFAKIHVNDLTKKALSTGWKKKEGVKASNISLFM